ncbi:MAG: ABC transporter ATP-binding protein [Candidatus Lokiarchaeota archaeon]|nr:ABC transporter ATP-binding protein [Candidatus Lokiarchaeota archaeon]
MVRIVKYAKPYVGMILFAIALLFAQVNLDLLLPDYMSNIVDTGIQHGGVESSAPIAYSQEQMFYTSLFWDNETESMVFGYYTLLDNSSENYDEYVNDYPLLENQSVYVLNNLRRKDKTDLYQNMTKAILASFAINQIILNPEMAIERGFDIGFNITSWDNITTLPLSVRSMIAEGIYDSFSALGESWIDQITVTAIRAEYISVGMDMDKLQRNYILRVGAFMLLFTLLSVVCTIFVGYFASQVAARMARDVRYDVFEKVEGFSSTEFDKYSTASLITRSTNDVTQLQMVIFFLIRLVAFAPLMGIGGIIRALGKAQSMWWIIALAVLILIGLVMITFAVGYPKFKSMQILIDRLNLVAREHLSGIMVIRAFNRQKFEEKRFDKANLDLTKVTLFTNRIIVILMPMMMLIMNGLTIGIIWVGGHEIADATMQVGDLMAFLTYAMQIVMSFLMISVMFIILPRASVSATRIREVLNTEPIINDPIKPKTFSKPPQGLIEFRNVSFRYPKGEEDALHSISFTAKPGETTALIGATGSGKSTLVNLIPRFYDISSGEILIDGIDIRDITQDDLRKQIGYVPQKNTLFSGTIESNMRYANENADQELIQSVIEIAQAKQFIESSSEGFSRAISQGGSNVSGGQKQRLSIARALIRQSPILIFDDSFSALDFKTDAALRRALKKYIGDCTVLIVTQRVSTVMYAEQIIVLEEGKIVGKGTHNELLKTCETYREIAFSQLKEDALS